MEVLLSYLIPGREFLGYMILWGRHFGSLCEMLRERDFAEEKHYNNKFKLLTDDKIKV